MCKRDRNRERQRQRKRERERERERESVWWMQDEDVHMYECLVSMRARASDVLCQWISLCGSRLSEIFTRKVTDCFEFI